MTVLLVENFNAVRDRFANLLREQLPAPVQILEADTAGDAMVLFRTEAPDVVVLDLQLEQGSGFDALEKMRTENPTIPVVVLTNYATPQYRERCLQLGARAFFDKSFEFDRAATAVGHLACKGSSATGVLGSA